MTADIGDELAAILEEELARGETALAAPCGQLRVGRLRVTLEG